MFFNLFLISCIYLLDVLVIKRDTIITNQLLALRLKVFHFFLRVLRTENLECLGGLRHYKAQNLRVYFQLISIDMDFLFAPFAENFKLGALSLLKNTFFANEMLATQNKRRFVRFIKSLVTITALNLKLKELFRFGIFVWKVCLDFLFH